MKKPNETTTIETAIAALENLRDFIEHEIIADYESAKDDPENGVNGWKPTDKAKEFTDSFGDDGLRMKLIEIGMNL